VAIGWSVSSPILRERILTMLPPSPQPAFPAPRADRLLTAWAEPQADRRSSWTVCVDTYDSGMPADPAPHREDITRRSRHTTNTMLAK
jgi:hypothetical protein